MKFYNKIRFFSRCCLVFSVLIVTLVGIQSLLESDVITLFLCVVAVFAVLIPQYYLVYLVEKQKQRNDDNLKKASNAVVDMISGNDGGFESNFEKEVADDDELALVSECMKKQRNLFLDFRKKEKLLNEILVSTVVNRELEKFLGDVMPQIMNITGSQFIVFYLANKTTNKLEIKSSIGFGKDIYSQFDISMGEGFLGQAAVDNEIVIIKGLDDDSVYVAKTFLGDIKPKNIIAVPVTDVDDENEVLGVLAVGSVYEYTEKHVEILKEIKKYVAYAVINGVFYNKSTRLTKELKFQNQLIQNLNEDLELKIKERTVFLNNILDSIKGYAIISIDISKNIVMINDGAVEMFNISRDSVIGKNISKIPNIEDYIRDDETDYIEIALKANKACRLFDMFFDDGKKALTEVEIFSVRDEYSDISGFTVVIRDISYINKLKSSEVIQKKIMDIMLEESTSSIVVVKDDFSVEGISKNAEYLIGFDKNGVYGKKVWEIFANGKEVKEFVNDVFDGKENGKFNAVALNTKINITMKSKLISDDLQGVKKVLIYL